MTIVVYDLKLATKAKSSGGDKYQIVNITDKPRFLYIPQKLSRNGTVKDDLQMSVSSEGEGIKFNLKKKGKSGDDRYSSEDPEWPGDIYLVKEIREETLYIIIS